MITVFFGWPNYGLPEIAYYALLSLLMESSNIYKVACKGQGKGEKI
jgi:hypothetical protein